MPGLPFITSDVASRPSDGADAAVPDLDRPDAEEIRAGLHLVLAEAAAGGISGFEDDAEVEHGLDKENVRLMRQATPNS